MVLPPTDSQEALTISQGRAFSLYLRPSEEGWSYYVESNSLLVQTCHVFPATEQGWIQAWKDLSAAEQQRERATVAGRASHQVTPRERAIVAGRPSRQVPPPIACVLLGGFGYGSWHYPGMACELRISPNAFQLVSARGTEILHRDLDKAKSLEFGGPGVVQSGGRFMGGGFGVTAAIEGMLIADVLNRLTRRVSIQTIIRFQDPTAEVFLFTSADTPDRLRIRYSEAVNQVGSAAQSPVIAPSLTDELGRLIEMHRQGFLNDAEFAAAKARLIAG